MLFLAVLTPTTVSSPGDHVQVGVLLAATPITPSTFPISHIVFIIQENHAYDNFYGVYCQKTGVYCPTTGNGIPTGTCVNIVPATPSGGCIKPFALSSAYVNSTLGGSHNWGSSHKSYDNGLMDGFYAAAPHLKEVLGYYNGSTIPTYWNMAEQYGLGDDFFSPALSYSLPNHWYAVAGDAPAVSESPPSGAFQREGLAQPLTGSEMQYLNESNATPSLDDELANSSTSWAFYDNSLQNVSYGYAVNQTVLGNASLDSVFDYWNPLIAKAGSYTPTLESRFLPRAQFANDTAGGTLPDVSWIIPGNTESDHPPDSLNAGESFVDSILSAVQTSKYWNNTAIFVTWDEYGGYYDHVAPPQVDGDGLGFRVPLLVFSAYTPAGYISHTFTHFESVMHLDEWRYGLGNLTARDGLANLPLDYFDLNATPRAPYTITAGAPYPMKEQPEKLTGVSGLSVNASYAGANLTWTETPGGSPVAGFLVKWGIGKTPSTSLYVNRTQNTLAVGKLVCNTTYTFQVSTFAGSTVSRGTSIRATTAACGPVAVTGGSAHGALPGGLGEKARVDPARSARSPANPVLPIRARDVPTGRGRPRA